MTQKMLSLSKDLRILQFGRDRRFGHEDLSSFRDLLTRSGEFYPGIEKWFDRRVIQGFREGSRKGFLAFQGNKPIGTAVVKKGRSIKFCNLRIDSEWEDNKLGTLLIALMTLSVGTQASQMHFTIPESLWAKTRGFFAPFGFKLIGKAETQYRLWEEELVCQGRISDALRVVTRKLPLLLTQYAVNGHSADCSIVMSIKPRYAEQIIAREKVVELRRVFSAKWQGRRALLYASAPRHQFVGSVSIREVQRESPAVIWRRHQEALGCTRREFDAYCGDRKEVSALLLSNVQPFRNCVYRNMLSQLLSRDVMPPQSFAALDNSPPWSEAASIVCALQGSSPENGLADETA